MWAARARWWNERRRFIADSDVNGRQPAYTQVPTDSGWADRDHLAGASCKNASLARYASKYLSHNQNKFTVIFFTKNKQYVQLFAWELYVCVPY